ncbi:MAG: ABC transporter permease [Actinobacteria bacterium]|nr:ABC transporter permease [Actinomycetota bacterium]MCL6094491.1 ABC transporter permease [Actinomycetota bacterium]
MPQIVVYGLPGIPLGCIFALIAVGLVLAYTTSGVFNLAFGAEAYAAALLFYVAVHAGWPKWAAFVVSVVLFGPALGLAMDRYLFRHIRTASTLAKLIASLGLLIAIPRLTEVIFGNAVRMAPPSLILNPNHIYFHLGSYAVSGIEISTVGVTTAALIVLIGLFGFTQLGLRMRAVVESPRMVQLTGINADRVSMVAWVISGAFASLAGVLLAPLYAQLLDYNFTGLLVSGIAAAAIGGFTSLPLAFAGGIGLGVIQEILGGYLPSGSILSSGLQDAFPFLVLVVMLVALPSLKREHETNDPLASCDPPPPPLASTLRNQSFDRWTRYASWTILFIFVLSVVTWIPGNWVFTLSQGMVFSIIFLSITLLTGMSGQLSLAQATFAGVGAFAAGQLADHFGLSVIAGMFVGGLLAAAVGIIVAIPTLRMGTLALALGTFALALLVGSVVFPYSWAGNGNSGISVPRPLIGPVSFQDDRAFFLLSLVILVLCSLVIIMIRRGMVGRSLLALRSSEVAASTIGIDVRRLKIMVFALSSGIAGIGGALFASLQQSVSPADFSYDLSLLFVVVVVTAGVRTVEGAIEAGIGYYLLLQIMDFLPARYSGGVILPILFGLGALSYARHPEGLVEFQKRVWTERLLRLRDRLGGTPSTPDSDLPDEVVIPAVHHPPATG